VNSRARCILAAAGLGLLALTACASAPTAAPPATTVAQAGSCQVNPTTAPVPTAEPYEPVPKADGVSVALKGITSGTITPGSAPTEVDVTVCNNSPVSYPQVGVVVVLAHCSCAPGGAEMAVGTVERFDPATGDWIQLDHPSAGTGMDYLAGSANVQALPKGKAVTLRYRITLSTTMSAGKGGVSATAVLPDGPYQLGSADLPFTVLSPPASPRQTTLPFTGLDSQLGVAVDTTGNVYVADLGNKRVVKLPAGSSTPTVVPLPGIDEPTSVAVDTADNLYVIDSSNHRVVELPVGSSTQIVLPFTGIGPRAVAVDTAGNVYVTDGGSSRVLKLAAGASAPTVLPFPGLKYPMGVAVNPGGDVYVTDNGNHRVMKLAVGASAATVLPFSGLDYPVGVAVDAEGDVYTTDGEHDEVVELVAGSTTPTVLPITGITPTDVAVDLSDNVYITGGNGQVVKFAAG
jgi:streptogramin lyase